MRPRSKVEIVFAQTQPPTTGAAGNSTEAAATHALPKATAFNTSLLSIPTFFVLTFSMFVTFLCQPTESSYMPHQPANGFDIN